MDRPKTWNILLRLCDLWVCSKPWCRWTCNIDLNFVYLLELHKLYQQGVSLDPFGSLLVSSSIFRIKGYVREGEVFTIWYDMIHSGKYRILFWGFPLGIGLSFIPWLLAKRYPKFPWKNLSIPCWVQFRFSLILPGKVFSTPAERTQLLPLSFWLLTWTDGIKVDIYIYLVLLHGSITPPQIPTNMWVHIFSSDMDLYLCLWSKIVIDLLESMLCFRITVGLLAAVLSQYWALRYRTKWFEKYNYVLSR